MMLLGCNGKRHRSASRRGLAYGLSGAAAATITNDGGTPSAAVENTRASTSSDRSNRLVLGQAVAHGDWAPVPNRLGIGGNSRTDQGF
jgi:hypothetical protein